MTGYTPSARARSAVATLLYAVEAEPVPDTHMFAEDGLSRDYQRALAVLRACACSDAQSAAVPPPASEASPSPQPEPERIMSRFGGGEQEVRTVDITKLHGFFDQSEPLPVPSPEPQPVQMPDAAAQPEAGPPGSAALPPPPRKDAQPATPVSAPPPTASLLSVRKTVPLRNARAGEPYSGRLAIEGARDLKLVNAGRSGLVFDEQTGVFSGTPEEAGDHELRLKGRIDDRLADITATLIVVADPKSLWKSLPSDPTLPFAKPDEAFRAIEGEALRMFAASKRGRSHARDAGFREDDFALAAHGAWHIVAVADGAGSASLSRRGSRLAVQTATEALQPLIDEHLGDDFLPLVERHLSGEPVENEIGTRLYNTLVAAAYKAAEALVSEAERLDESIAKLSTTIILIIARRVGERWFVAGFSIGDGGAAVFDVDASTVHPLTAPDSGEYAGQTRFLARSEFGEGSDVTKRLRFATPERFTAIAVMSDGITDPKLPTDRAFAEPTTWATLWKDDLTKDVDFSAPVGEIEAKFLAWLDFWSPGNHDDRTLAVLLPAEKG